MVFGSDTNDGARRYLTKIHRSPATGHTCIPTGLAMCRVRMQVHRGDLTLRPRPSLCRLMVARVRYPQAAHKAIRPHAQARTVRDALKHEAHPV